MGGCWNWKQAVFGLEDDVGSNASLNRGFIYRAVVTPLQAGRTVLALLASERTHSSAADWAARIAAGEVLLDARPARADDVVHAGQVLTWHRPPWDEPAVPLHFDVLHEDEDVLAVAKPSGLPTMPAGGFLEHTLLAVVRARHGDAHPVHRLGRFTSGIVLFARTRHAAAALGRAWREHAVFKEYRALGGGTASWETRDLTTPIGPVPHPLLGTVHAASPDGRVAHSTATVVERRQSSTLFDVRITTGRPHQIRVHLAAAGHPLVGDPLYAEGGLPRAANPGLPGDGGYLLHAHRLECAHPNGRWRLTLRAPPPQALESHAEKSSPPSAS